MRKKVSNEKAKEYRDRYHAQNPGLKAKWNRDWIKNHPDEYNAAKYLYRERQKRIVLTHYSVGSEPQCALCGFDDIDCLCLDHINNDGASDRRQRRVAGRGRTGVDMYTAVKRDGFPDGYQVLCANCNTKKELERKRQKRLENAVYKARKEGECDAKSNNRVAPQLHSA